MLLDNKPYTLSQLGLWSATYCTQNAPYIEVNN